MPEQFLTTKIIPPPVHSVRVSRGQLNRSLDQSLRPGCKVILLAAATGFGKTTLISEWLNQNHYPAAWISLEEGDNDLRRFWGYLLVAFRKTYAGFADDAFTLVNSPEAFPINTVLTLFLNALAALSEHVFLVLDDYHVIESEAIHQSLAFFLDHLPPHIHVVITSRIDPPLPLAKLRARGEMVELRAAHLRFDLDEATAFFHEVMDIELPSDAIEKLDARTEGWIAGLQLAALSIQGLQHQDDVERFIAAFTGSHRHVGDYLVEEVLHKQSESVQTFLLQTSILDRLCGPLCDAVTRQSDSRDRLERLERADLFIVPLDQERHWYRYHHLFADLLRARLAHGQPEPTAELHRRAAHWYEENGLIREALHHIFETGDFEWAAQLVMANTTELFGRGEFSTLQTWLNALPPQIVLSYPRLCIDRARLLYLGHQLSEMESLLDAAEFKLKPYTDEESRSLLGEVWTLRGYLPAERGDFRQSIEFLQRALELLPDEQASWRGKALLFIAHSYFKSGDPQSAVPYSTEANAIFRAARNVHGTMTTSGQLGMTYWVMGELRQAKEVLENDLQWAVQHGYEILPPAAGVYNWLGNIYRERNDLEVAENYLKTGLELATMGRPLLVMRGCVFLAHVKHAQGDFEAAEKALRRAEIMVQNWETPWATWFLIANRVHLWLKLGNLQAAVQWAQFESNGVLRPGENITHYRERELISLARVFLACAVAYDDEERLIQAVEVLERLHTNAVRIGRLGIVIELLVLRALVRLQQGDHQSALHDLKAALSIAEPEGYVRVFIDEGKPMTALLNRIESSHPQRAYAQNLLAILRAELGATTSAPSGFLRTAEGMYLEALSEREMEVLRLLAEGFSSNEIAEKLIISIGTARKHVKNIYGKLDVHSRLGAIRRAEDLGLL